MKHLDTIIYFALATGALYMGVVGKAFYTGALARKSTRKVPTWFGRAWFIGFGLVVLYLGIAKLR